MLGFSFIKLLLLAAALVLVWYGFKFIGRLDRMRGKELAGPDRSERVVTKNAGIMLECSKCHAYVPELGSLNCSRRSCPY